MNSMAANAHAHDGKVDCTGDLSARAFLRLTRRRWTKARDGKKRTQKIGRNYGITLKDFVESNNSVVTTNARTQRRHNEWMAQVRNNAWNAIYSSKSTKSKWSECMCGHFRMVCAVTPNARITGICIRECCRWTLVAFFGSEIWDSFSHIWHASQPGARMCVIWQTERCSVLLLSWK